MVTGSNPWHGDTMGKLKTCILRGVYQLRKRTPPDIVTMIGRMIVQDPDDRITMAELSELPLFKEAPSPSIEGITDCLAPLGRRQMPIIAIPEGDAPSAPKHVKRKAKIPSVKEMTLETSATLTIASWNLRRGFSVPGRLPARYPLKNCAVTFHVES
jgi:serine/threonine protein kinase